MTEANATDEGRWGWARTALAVWITYLLIFSWLPLVRVVMDGDTYRWATGHFGIGFAAVGWESDAWLLVFKVGTLAVLLWATLRARGPVARWGLFAWCSVFAASVVHAVFTRPGGLTFSGDTLGIRVDLGWPAIVLSVGFALVSLAWAWSERSRGWPSAAAGPSRRMTWGLLAIALLLPVQFFLLRFGEPHGSTDAAGVLLTIAECPLLAWSLWPGRATRDRE